MNNQCIKEYLERIAGKSGCIECDSKKMGGAPVIKGTRMPVSLITSCLKDGMSLDGICEEYGVRPQYAKMAIEYMFEAVDEPYNDECGKASKREWAQAMEDRGKVCSNCKYFTTEECGTLGTLGVCLNDQYPLINTAANMICEFWEELCASDDDSVLHPGHYCEGREYEPVKVIQDWGLSFCLGNALKYIARAGRKGDATQDLKKAIQYLEFEIERIENEDLTREEVHD